jgi:hypothetical protein
MVPFTIVALGSGVVRAQPAEEPSVPPPPSAPADEQAPAPPWPRVLTSGTKTWTVQEPQPDRWDNGKLWATSPVTVRDSSTNRSVQGLLHWTAMTDIDKTQGLVSLHNVSIESADFPADPTQASNYKKTIDDSGILTSVIALGRLQAGLEAAAAERQASRQVVENPSPQIFVSQMPAVLVRIDGAPVLHPVEGTELTRVVNTRALLLHDATAFYLALGDHWVQSTTLNGAWSTVEAPKPELAQAKEALAPLIERGDIDLLAQQVNDLGPTLAVYVSTSPAELIQTNGSAQLAPINGTNLWYVTNTTNDLFTDTSTKRYYAVISGRWFEAPSLTGPWRFEPVNQLPSDFKRISTSGPKANVLASIPGTPQAQEAVIANQIVETATVPRRDGPTLDVDYDGPPQFSPIEQTQLSYATNTSTPVIAVSPTAYYAVRDGVWFAATSPTGPWAVATSVPAEIYSIPTSSPMHYVTYVYVDGATPDYVYSAYAPGYLGTVVAPPGVVVYGTGYDYTPWIGNYWYGGPWTFGFGAGFALGAVGFGFAFSPFFVAPLRGQAFFVSTHVHPAHFDNVHVAHFDHVDHVHLASVNVFHGWNASGVVARGPAGGVRGVAVAPRGVGGGPVLRAPVRGIGGGPPAVGVAPRTIGGPSTLPPQSHRPDVAPSPAFRAPAPAPVFRGAAPPPAFRAPAPVAPVPHSAPPPAFPGGGGMHGGGGGMHGGGGGMHGGGGGMHR